jgi:hypothetical protein
MAHSPCSHPRVLQLHGPAFWDELGDALKAVDAQATLYVVLSGR